MVYGYLNIPTPLVTAHRNPNCGNIQSQGKQGQRVLHINPANAAAELNNFHAGNYRFAPQATINDMWLVIDLGNAAAELNFFDNVHQALAQRYTRFAKAQRTTHC